MNIKNILILVLGIIVIVTGVFLFISLDKNNSENETTKQPATFSAVSLAVLNPNLIDGEKPDQGCDKVVFIERAVPATTAPLTAALTELFSLKGPWLTDNQYNFISQTNSTLLFDHATVANGTANIYLTGALSGLAGVCDDPRASIQIKQTALQFSTVQNVQLYLNGEPTDLTPSGKGI